jgi:serine/threonine-protein kinase
VQHGSRLGDFEIDGVLGEGGSSVVYAARWGAREVALKVIQSEGPVTEADRTRFLAEAERMQRVVHSSLISLLGAGFLPDGRPFIAMPRLRGRTLADHSAPIAIEQALALFEDVVHGVSALHAAGLVHRDIKPQNIMWVEPEDRLVLLDLGIAREIDASPSTTTRAGFSRGTPAYMAPERLFGQSATLRSDLYELALVLVVMLLGRLPWEEGDPQGRMLPDLSASGPNGALIPQALAPTLARALSLDVERRPTSASELLAWIVEAHPPTQKRFNLATAPTELHRTPQAASRQHVFAVSGFPMSLPASEQGSPPQGFITQPSTPIQRAALLASSPPPAPAPAASPRNIVPFVAIGGALVMASVGAALLVRDRVPEATTKGAPSATEAPSSVATATPSSAADAAGSSSPTVSPGFGPAGPSASPTASASSAPSAGPKPSVTPSATSKPSATSVTPTSPSATSSGSATSAPMSAACKSYVALMCSPSSGASALECSSARSNAASWTTKFPTSVASETCQSALNASQIGLAGRKDWQPP